jgi:hypothetical protein
MTAFIFGFLVFSCKHIEKVAAPKKIRHLSRGRVIKLVNEKSLHYETLTVRKVNFSLNNEGKETSIRGSYKIRRDSVIQMYAQKLSIPVGKLEVSQDSFKFAYFIDQELFIGANSYLSKLLGLEVDYSILEALLSNQLFSVRQDSKESEFMDYACEIEDQMYKISSIRTRKLKRIKKSDLTLERYRNRLDVERIIKQEIYIDADSFVVKKMIFKDLNSENGIKLEFSRYEKVMEQWFPGLMQIEVLGKNKVKLAIELSKVTLNDEKNFGFSVSPKYKTKLIE